MWWMICLFAFKQLLMMGNCNWVLIFRRLWPLRQMPECTHPREEELLKADWGCWVMVIDDGLDSVFGRDQG